MPTGCLWQKNKQANKQKHVALADRGVLGKDEPYHPLIQSLFSPEVEGARSGVPPKLGPAKNPTLQFNIAGNSK